MSPKLSKTGGYTMTIQDLDSESLDLLINTLCEQQHSIVASSIEQKPQSAIGDLIDILETELLEEAA